MLIRNSRVPEDHFELKQMPLSLRPLTVCILYSAKDQAVKDKASAYFQLLQSEGITGKTRYFELENQPANWWLKAIEEWNVFVLLVTIDLVTNPSYRQLLNKLKTEHKMDRIALLPILIGEAGIRLKQFENLLVFPSSKCALQSGFWDTPDNFYFSILDEVIAAIKEFAVHKENHDDLWSATCAADQVGAYNYFLEEYPYSRHADDAREKIRILVEKGLLEKLDHAELASDYYEYIVNTPLDEERDQAALKISEIENDEDLIWAETKDKARLEDLLEYRCRFPKGKYLPEVSRLIEMRLMENAHVDYVISRGNAKLLKKLAYDNLHKSEIYSLERHLDYLDDLDRKLAGIISEWWFTKDAKFFPFFGVVLSPMIFVLFTSALVSQVLLLCVSAFVFYRVRRGMLFQNDDRNYLADARNELQKLQVLLKIYFITHDQQSKNKVMHLLWQIDQQSDQIKKKGPWNYLSQKEKIEEFDLEKLLPKGRR